MAVDQGDEKWTAVQVGALGGATFPGAYFGDFATREEALEASANAMLANGWRRTWREAADDAAKELQTTIAR